MSPELATFLNEFRQPTNIGKVRATITLEDYTDGIKDRKKTTSTSPSGRHLENKAALHDEDLSQIHVDMLILLILYGFASGRWLLSVMPLIEKEEGKPYLTSDFE